MYGITDKPVSEITEDMFGIENYIKGLNEFICQCDTPMTIAIQGDWGTGKTSFMNMIKHTMSNNILPIWFNT